MAGGCALRGGCPSDYVAVAAAALSLVLQWRHNWTYGLLIRAAFPFLVHKGYTSKTNGFWLIILQLLGSFNLILALVISVGYLESSRSHPWQSCYTWAVWFEGPLGFGLLMSCRIVWAYELHQLFVKRRLPPVGSGVSLLIILLPWVAGATLIHIKKPLNHRCHIRGQWVIPVVCIHGVYVVALIGTTWTIRHIDFRFHELKELVRGIVVSSIAIGLWIVAYILNEVHEDVSWVQLASRFLLLVMASILVLVFFSVSVSQPILPQKSLKRRDSDLSSIGQALGIPSNATVNTACSTSINSNQPLDRLLLNNSFRHSFMTFAESCLAGESVHFYCEAHELEKIPIGDTIRRIYMARHLIKKYIVPGAEMEVNVSHKTRQEILGALDLARPELFDHAMAELLQLMKMNLLKDYWSSTFFTKLKGELREQTYDHEVAGGVGHWDSNPRPSCVHGADDPFHQEHVP